MTQYSDVTMERVDVRVEVYDVDWQTTGDDVVREFQADRTGFMRNFLESRGHKVNRIDFVVRSQQEDPGDKPAADASAEGPVEQRMPDRNYHIVYPGNEESGWICCCA
jgi:hypothetical protein